MAAFSRLQLAAALLEYDNDPDNPGVGRSAQDSAIFAHLRRGTPRKPNVARRSTDYLGIDMPSEGGRSSAPPEDTDLYRQSTSSINHLVNPFGKEEEHEEIEEEENLDVDLASWGLDAFMPKEKEKGKRTRTKSQPMDYPQPVHKEAAGAQTVSPRMRSMSMGNMDQFGVGGAFLEAGVAVGTAVDARRNSFASPLDFAGSPVLKRPARPRRQSSHALIDNIPLAAPLHSIPFPSNVPVPDDGNSMSRPLSRGSLLNGPRPSSRASEALLDNARTRRPSMGSLDSRMMLDDELPNPFAVRPPSPDRASRFDPKSHGRTPSVSSRELLADENNPFSLPLPSPSRASRFDPKGAARARSASMASMGDVMSYMSGDREQPYSRIELMRPKVLIMPSPLQNVDDKPPPPKGPAPRPGFQLSTDGPPLPAAARSSRRLSSNPLATLHPSPTGLSVPGMSLSQTTFRSSLMVGGHADIEIPRAMEDGEQAQFPEPIEPIPTGRAISVIVDEPTYEQQPTRPAGKLFGKSLIDDLEDRKATMRGKQRVFTGDDRPSMMARTAMTRSSTLIDPESLQQRPATQRLSSFNSLGPHDGRRNTLLNLDDSPGRSPTSPAGGLLGVESRMPKSRSVFGVDTLWEREMTKLKDIEAREKAEAEERRKREEEEAKKITKGKGKGKGKAKDDGLSPLPSPSLQPSFSEPRVPAEPPRLPQVQRATASGPPPVLDDGDDESSDEDEDRPVQPPKSAEGWVSSDDEGPRRTTGVGPRPPKKPMPRPSPDSDSDEDVPLAATIHRAVARTALEGALPLPADDDSDEDKPLAAIIPKTSLSLPAFDFAKSVDKPADDEDDEDKPLGLRASRLPSIASRSNFGGQDDDVPLGLRPDQQRRTHYLAQQQQQAMMLQAQMTGSFMMQPQMTGSMYFGASPLGPAPPMMGSPFFGPMGAMVPPAMMMAPPQIPSPPPAHDAAKLNRVDQWRHDVAVNGEEA